MIEDQGHDQQACKLIHYKEIGIIKHTCFPCMKYPGQKAHKQELQQVKQQEEQQYASIQDEGMNLVPRQRCLGGSEGLEDQQ